MGASASKDDAGLQHVFKADVPVNFSGNLLNSLESSPETDGTRAKNLELIIQRRVTSELEKHLAASEEKVSKNAESASAEAMPANQQAKESDDSGKSIFSKISEKLSSSSSDEEKRKFRNNLDSEAVSKEISELKKKLEGRKRVVEKDKEVEKAKDKMVACLRLNDRRPLDCWHEVEKFKMEVGRLERSFVEKNGG